MAISIDHSRHQYRLLENSSKYNMSPSKVTGAGSGNYSSHYWSLLHTLHYTSKWWVVMHIYSLETEYFWFSQLSAYVCQNLCIYLGKSWASPLQNRIPPQFSNQSKPIYKEQYCLFNLTLRLLLIPIYLPNVQSVCKLMV